MGSHTVAERSSLSSLATHPFSQDLREPCKSSTLQPNVIETRRWVENRGRREQMERERERKKEARTRTCTGWIVEALFP